MPGVVTLTPSDLEFGRLLTAKLRDQHFPYRGVFWWFEETSDDWRLVIVTEKVDELGPRATYRDLTQVTKSLPASDFQLLRISVMAPKNPVYAALYPAFSSAANVEGTRLHNTMVNGL